MGQPLARTAPTATDHRPTFVLGAYPSALHVRWDSPPGRPGEVYGAIPVDNEPEPFWDGSDAVDRIEAWKVAVGFAPTAHGSVSSAGYGSSGRQLDAWYLEPLGLERDACWITDCLDTYRTSENGRPRIEEAFGPPGPGKAWDLPPHPNRGDIATEAKAAHLGRIRTELAAARPELVITLGDDALWVFAELADADGAPPRLRWWDYGRAIEVQLDGRAVRWLPLAHPGSVSRSRTWPSREHHEWRRLEQHLRENGGRLYRRVVVATCHEDDPDERHDHTAPSVWFPDLPDGPQLEGRDHEDQFIDDLAEHDAVVLGARGYADRTLFGELVVARELLAQRWPQHLSLRCAALSDEPEPNMDWVYQRNGMAVLRSTAP